MSFVATVTRVTPLSPRIVRVAFSVPRFRGVGCADEWVGIFFGAIGDHGSRRNYTIRALRPERDEVDIDFVLHDSGIAVDWVRAAEPGQQLRWWDRIGSCYAPPQDAEWQLLAGDASALPAIGRIVEQLPSGTRAIVLAELEDPADRQSWTTAGDVEVRWLDARRPSCLEAAVRGFREPPGTGYFWMAGETRSVRAVRRYLRHERGLARERHGLTGYWLVDAAQWAARYERVADQMERIWTSGEAEGRDPEAIIDDYDAALERAGL